MISAVAHAALFGLLARMVVPAKVVVAQAPSAEPTPVEVVDVARPPESSRPESPPIEVVMLEPAPGERIEAAHVEAAHIEAAHVEAAHVEAAHVEAAHDATSAHVDMPGAQTTTREPPGPGAGGGYLHMRGPDLALDGTTAEHIAASGNHPLPAEPKVTGKIDNVSGGTGVIHDRVTTVDIERDGTAHFHDKRDIDVKLKLPIPHLDFEGMRKDLGKTLTDWYRDPYASTRFGRTQDLSRINQAVPGACDEWGSIWCDDPLAPDAEKYVREQKKTNGSLLGGPADITAYLHRKLIGDPYASRKLKLLDDTRDERVARGTVFRDQQLARSAELIQRNLARLDRANLATAELHEALFELWDECGEGEGPEGAAGQRARAQVLGWIGAHLPKGSPRAFSDEEVVAFDGRRTSKQRFFPY